MVTSSGEPALFIGHGAERSGPPIGLLHLLRWVRRNTDLEFAVLLLEGGELLGEYQAVAPTTVLDEWNQARRTSPLATAAGYIGSERVADTVRRRSLRARLRPLGPRRRVYVNTAWSIRALHFLETPDAAVVTAIHELSVGLRHHLQPPEHRLLVDRTRHFFAVADAVKDDLVRHHRIAPDRVSVHKEMIAVEAAPPAGHATWAREQRRSLGIPDEALIVGGSGFTHWRKAPDLFVLLARLVVERTTTNVHFLWVGGDPQGSDGPFGYDVDRGGLSGRVHFVGHHSRPMDWFRLFDVMALTSREDAFPLVCLEAASLGTPIVCFDRGGIPEFVRSADSGVVVAFPDVDAFADAVVEYVESPGRRGAAGARAAAEVAARHDVEARAPELVAELLRRWSCAS